MRPRRTVSVCSMCGDGPEACWCTLDSREIEETELAAQTLWHAARSLRRRAASSTIRPDEAEAGALLAACRSLYRRIRDPELAEMADLSAEAKAHAERVIAELEAAERRAEAP